MILYLSLFFFIYVLHSYYKKTKKISEKQLNGPKPLPVFGNLIQLGDQPHYSLTELHKTYGSIYRIWMGDCYTIVINNPDILREMFVKNFDAFTDRPETPSFKYYSSNYRSLSLGNGQYWQRNKTIVGNALTKTKLKSIYTLIDNQIAELVSSMKTFSSSSQPFPPRRYTQRFTMNTMLKYLFNDQMPFTDDFKTGRMSKLMEPIDEVFKDLSSGKLGDFIDILGPLYYLYVNLTDSSLPKIKKFIREEYYQHLKTIDKENPRDMMDLLINEIGTGEEDIDIVVSVCVDLLTAGSHTVSGTIEWFILLMANNPNVLEKAYNEIKTVVGDRSIQLTDRNLTPYVNAVIKECMRHKVIGPFGLPRVSSKDIIISNYFIPKGSQILPNYRGIYQNTDFWENPSEFNPSRFLSGSKFDAFIPFGIGPRNCIGQSLAQDELYLAIATIISKFKISSTDGKLIDETEKFGLTLHPNLFKVNLESR